ncbi:MAG: hypothetical protein ACK4ME_09615 [Fimbriimonadales bacterium]
MRFGLCLLGMLGCTTLWTQSLPPIQRVIIYKDGHCFTEREVVVDTDKNPLLIENAFNALLGGVWATTRHKTAQLESLCARFVEETRAVAPASLAELLMLNEGKRIAVTVDLTAEASPSPRLVRYEGVLRVLKPNLLYTDAFPTAEPPPDYTPFPENPVATDRWGYAIYTKPSAPSDYAQDRLGRAVKQAAFVIETENRLAIFDPQQVREIEFLETPVRERTITVKRPVLELRVTGAQRGERVPVLLVGIEKGVRWFPEYQLVLPTARAAEATLKLGGVIRNELEDLNAVEASVAVGTFQFMMKDQPSPLNQRDAFRTLSSWFGAQQPSPTWWYASSPRFSEWLVGGGFGGSGSFGGATPSVPPGMGFEQHAREPAPADTLTFFKLPQRITLPKDSAVRVDIAEQKVSVEHTYVWIHDLNEREWRSYTRYEPVDQRALTIDDIAYLLAQERRFRREVYEAILLRNTGSTPWTTAPITVLRGNATVGQDVLLYTPLGDEAIVFLTPVSKIAVTCTVEPEPKSDFAWTRGKSLQRATIQVTNLYEYPVRLMVRLRFLGRYEDATRQPLRVVAKSVGDERFWQWYYSSQLRTHPYTEITWDVEVPPGASEWQMRFLAER